MEVEGRNDDPFDWGIERVIQELCSPDRPWDPYNAARLPDPAVFEAKLREHEVSGELLLCYADYEDHATLLKDLGITKLRHKMSLSRAIMHFKSLSNKYREFKNNFLNDGEHTNSAQLKDAGNQSMGEKRKASPLIEVPSSGDVNVAKEQTPGLPPSKKKKIAPTTVAPLGRSTQPAELARRPMRPRPYFGRKGISVVDVFLPDSQVQDYNDTKSTTEERSFGWATPANIPNGERSVVNQFMKKLFQPGQSTTSRRRRRRNEPPTGTSDLSDEVLPAYGDSDDEYDTETWLQIQREAEENDRQALQQTGQKAFLSQEAVEAELDAAVASMKTAWEETKLPKLERKACRMWIDARRHGTRTYQLSKTRSTVQQYEVRLSKLRKEICAQSWSKPSEVRQQAGCLEQTVGDLLHVRWVIGVLDSPNQPPKPAQAPRNRRRQVPAQQQQQHRKAEEDCEILTSESENDFDDMMDLDDEIAVAELQDSMDVCNHDMELVVKAEMQAMLSCGSRIQPTHTGNPGTRPIPKDGPNSTTPSRPMPVLIDLTTPARPKSPLSVPRRRALTREEKNKEQKEKGDRMRRIPSSDVESIGNISPTDWIRERSAHKAMISMLWRLGKRRRDVLFKYVLHNEPVQIWNECIKPAAAQRDGQPETLADDAHLGQKSKSRLSSDLLELFGTYENIEETELVQFARSDCMKRRINEFTGFCHWMHGVMAKFRFSTLKTSSDEYDEDEDEEDDTVMDEDTSIKSSPPPGTDQATASLSKRQTRKRVALDKDAKMLRKVQLKQAQEQKERAQLLRERIAETGTRDQVLKSRLIINEAKGDNEGFIYVNSAIADRIKTHQVEGVRFMWNQITMDPKRMGCLLAHTMGLGKTMQVITLLLAIAEASASKDPSVVSQVPEDLRSSKTLILCPSSLVNNWWDELHLWAEAPSCLGQYYKIESVMTPPTRISLIQMWAQSGGVLLLSYDLFKGIIEDKLPWTGGAAQILQEFPTIVVADEAHMMKNPTSKLHVAANNFRTYSRIALTGSPMANNILEYHSMINWVAPNYLSSLKEFRAVYERPIHDGLFADSMPGERRKALTKLKALLGIVAPKVQRKTLASLARELPPKKEFVIYIGLTQLQADIYEQYRSQITSAHAGDDARGKQGCLFAILKNLALICDHPKAFEQKLQNEKRASMEARKKGERRTDNEVSLPEGMVSTLLAQLNRKDIKDIKYSHRTLIVSKIIDEARKVGDKVLIFCHSLPSLDYLESFCKSQQRSVARLDGKTPVHRRQDFINSFNNDGTGVYLISTTAGSLGLNIQGANRVIIFDFTFNPVNEDQAIARAYRLGQKKDVCVYRFVAAGTFEEAMQQKTVFKSQLQSRVVDQKNPIAWSTRKQNLLLPVKSVPKQDLSSFRGQDAVLDAVLNTPAADGITQILVTDTFATENLEEETLTAEEQQEVAALMRVGRPESRLPLETAAAAKSGSAKAIAVGTSSPSVMTPRRAASSSEGGFTPVQPPQTGNGLQPNSARMPVSLLASSGSPFSGPGPQMVHPRHSVQQDNKSATPLRTNPAAGGTHPSYGAPQTYPAANSPGPASHYAVHTNTNAVPDSRQQHGHREDALPVSIARQDTGPRTSLGLSRTPLPTPVCHNNNNNIRQTPPAAEANLLREDVFKNALVRTMVRSRSEAEERLPKIDLLAEFLSHAWQRDRGIPLMEKHIRTIEFCIHPHCHLAVLDGRVSPYQLATFTRPQLMRLADELKAQGTGNSGAARQGDPSHLDSVLHRTSLRQNSEPLLGMNQDMLAMREVADRRKHTPQPATDTRDAVPLAFAGPSKIPDAGNNEKVGNVYDDSAALREVMNRRSSRKQRRERASKDQDSTAMEEVMNRRQRLPHWAEKAVRDRQKHGKRSSSRARQASADVIVID